MIPSDILPARAACCPEADIARHGWQAISRLRIFLRRSPRVLASVGRFGLDPLRGARFLNALLFGLNIFGLGVLGWRMMKSLPAGLALAALFLLNASLLRVHAVAMSEPLFIFLSLLAFWMFDLYVERDAHWLWLLACGAFTGMAYLTRYAGLALVATFVLALMILHRTWRRRLTSTGIYLLGALPWVVGWAIRNQMVGGSVTNRVLVWHPITAVNFETALYNISTFLMPVEAWRRELFKAPGIFIAAIVLILAAVLAWTLWKARQQLIQRADARMHLRRRPSRMGSHSLMGCIYSAILPPSSPPCPSSTLRRSSGCGSFLRSTYRCSSCCCSLGNGYGAGAARLPSCSWL